MNSLHDGLEPEKHIVRISMYKIERKMEPEHGKSQDDSQYFVMGKNKIIIPEHFAADGEPLSHILTKLILNAGKAQEANKDILK